MLHAQKLESLGILAGGIAHDFNNLLTAILGNTDLALAELPQPSKVRPLVEQIQTASLRAAELTRQMLVFAGRGELATVPLDLSITVRESAEMFSGLAFNGSLQKPYRLVELKGVLRKVLG